MALMPQKVVGLMTNQLPPLKPLHSESSLVTAKIEAFTKFTTEELLNTLRPGQPGSLKVRPDGTIIDGHHRIKVLRDRGIDVDSLPRDIVRRRQDPSAI